MHNLGIYPVGSLVSLASNRLVLVVEQNAGALLKPRPRVFYSIDARQRLPVQTLDLAVDESDAIIGREEPESWGLAGLDRLWADIGAAG